VLQVVGHHSAELGKVVAEAERFEAAAQEHVAGARAAVARARRALDVQEQLAAKYKDTMLHLQELSLVVRFEEMANKERGQRHQAIDEVQSRVCVCAIDVGLVMSGALVSERRLQFLLCLV